METASVSFPTMLLLKTLCAGKEEGWADQKAVKVLDSSSSCCYFYIALEAAGTTKIKPFFFPSKGNNSCKNMQIFQAAEAILSKWNYSFGCLRNLSLNLNCREGKRGMGNSSRIKLYTYLKYRMAKKTSSFHLPMPVCVVGWAWTDVRCPPQLLCHSLPSAGWEGQKIRWKVYTSR